MNTNEAAPAWSDEANEQGRRAWLDAEQRLRDARTPHQRARELTDSEKAALADAQAEVDLALIAVEEAKSRLLRVHLTDVETATTFAQERNGMLVVVEANGHRKSTGPSADEFFIAKSALARAHTQEAAARSRMADVESRIGTAVQERYRRFDGAAT